MDMLSAARQKRKENKSDTFIICRIEFLACRTVIIRVLFGRD